MQHSKSTQLLQGKYLHYYNYSILISVEWAYPNNVHVLVSGKLKANNDCQL